MQDNNHLVHNVLRNDLAASQQLITLVGCGPEAHAVSCCLL